MLPQDVRTRNPVKKSKYHTRRPPKCKYCDKDAKRNEQPDGRNKGYYRTCGSLECLNANNRDKAVNARKAPRGFRTCEKCGVKFSISGWQQRWCLVCCPDKSARSRLQRYNISYPEFQKRLLAQEGKCAICKVREATDLDHSHSDGTIRHILCSKCNLGLHYIEDSEWSQKAEMYLAFFKS